MNKEKKRSKGIIGEDMEVRTFEDALRLIFMNTVPKAPGGVILVEVSSEEEEDPFGDEEMCECPSYESVRAEIFSEMTEDEIDAFDTVDNFINSPKAGLPEDDDSLESRIEHAEWNIDELREKMIHTLAAFEASVAYYSTLVIEDANQESLDETLCDITERIEDICSAAKEIQLLIGIVVSSYEADMAEKNLHAANEKNEILTSMLMDHYQAEGREAWESFYDDDDDDDYDDDGDGCGDSLD